MIARLAGTVLEKHPMRVVIDVGGVGYDVHVPLSSFAAVGDAGSRLTLRVHTHVREDALVLYGFGSALEQLVFERLIAVSGIGPKLALSVLSGLPPDELVQAIASANVARLTSIPGIGKKTAERIVLELKDRVASLGLSPEAQAPATSPEDQLKGDVLSALQNLGYHRPLADKAVEAALAEAAADAPASFERVFKRALRALMRP
jgi:Holliday junction DNA helicase RuvA